MQISQRRRTVMLYLMEEVHRLAFNNAPTGLSELDCVFLTLCLFPLRFPGLFVHSETHNNENWQRDGANRIPGHVTEGKGGACIALSHSSHRLLQYSHVVGDGVWKHIHTLTQHSWPHCTNIALHFLNPGYLLVPMNAASTQIQRLKSLKKVHCAVFF